MLASNRLPLRIVSTPGRALQFEDSAGGLVAALRGIGEACTWVGWPGAPVAAAQAPGLRRRLAAEALHPVLLTAGEEDRYYRRTCSELLWPLFHELAATAPFDQVAWAGYEAVNARFAEAVAACSPPGARVWVNDLHLMLVPAALRRLRPDLAIGFFLHVPFPAAGHLCRLPRQGELLAGVLGADCIGFQTPGDVERFRQACSEVLGCRSRSGAILVDGRSVVLGAHPAGIDAARFRRVLADSRTRAAEARLDAGYGGRHLVLGVDRLDATKGVPEKLRAFERYLEGDPRRAAGVALHQVLVPSRSGHARQRRLRADIDAQAARINARFGVPGALPVECSHGTVEPCELAALYRRADVMLVTPLRDGMNLVAQEFVLCQAVTPRLPGQGPGALVLSRGAGAAHSLRGALLVDPADTVALAARLAEALALAPDERQLRLEALARVVERQAAPNWARGFLAQLAGAAGLRAAA